MSIRKSREESRARGRRKGVMLFVSDHVGVIGLNGVTLTLGYHGIRVMTVTATECNLPSSGSPLANHQLTLTSLTNQQVI